VSHLLSGGSLKPRIVLVDWSSSSSSSIESKSNSGQKEKWEIDSWFNLLFFTS
jgi:hypothetical protein